MLRFYSGCPDTPNRSALTALRRSSLGTILLLVALGSCHSGTTQGAPSVRVELLVYSGQQNPAWELTEAEAQEFQRRLSELPVGPPPPQPPGLGYAGFSISVSPPTKDLPERIVVYKGVRVTAAGVTRRDEAGLEAWLRSLARNRGYADLLDAEGR